VWPVSTKITLVSDPHLWQIVQEIRTPQEVSACNFPIIAVVVQQAAALCYIYADRR
jgi:hypothetical protein